MLLAALAKLISPSLPDLTFPPYFKPPLSPTLHQNSLSLFFGKLHSSPKEQGSLSCYISSLLFTPLLYFFQLLVGDFPTVKISSSQGLRFHLPMQGVQVQPPVGELRSHIPYSQNKQTNKKTLNITTGIL